MRDRGGVEPYASRSRSGARHNSVNLLSLDSDRSEVQSVTDWLVGPRRIKGTAIRLQRMRAWVNLRAAPLPLNGRISTLRRRAA